MFKVLCHAVKDVSSAKGQGTRLQSVAPSLAVGLSLSCKQSLSGLACEKKSEMLSGTWVRVWAPHQLTQRPLNKTVSLLVSPVGSGLESQAGSRRTLRF